MPSPWKFIAAKPEILPRPDPRPEESLAAMDASVQASASLQSVDSPVLPCQRNPKWLELTVADPAGKPLANAPCKLLIPEGNGRQGTTDDSGFVRFGGIYADPATFQVRVTRDDAAEPPVWRITVVSRRAMDQAATPEPAPDENVDYVLVPWEEEDIKRST